MFLVIAALVLLVGGFFAYRYFSMYESTDDAEVDGHLMPLSARISGYVIKVNVDDNQYVTAGTVLAEIDPRDYQVALDQAKRRSGRCPGHRASPEYQRAHRLREFRSARFLRPRQTWKMRAPESPWPRINTPPPKRNSIRPKPTT